MIYSKRRTSRSAKNQKAYNGWMSRQVYIQHSEREKFDHTYHDSL